MWGRKPVETGFPDKTFICRLGRYTGVMSLLSDKTWRRIRILAAIMAIYLVAVMSARVFGRMSTTEPHPVFSPGFTSSVINIAHQGGNLERPDETEESFRHGLEAGADILELDVHLSADGYLIVIHDSTVNRTTNGNGRISEMNLPELKNLDAGFWWPYHSNDDVAKESVPADQEFPWRNRRLQLLTLDEVLDQFPDVPLNIEIKSGGEQAALATWRVLDKTDRLDDVLIVSSDPTILKAFREISPETATGADRGEVLRFWLLGRFGLAGFAGVKATALQVPVSQGKLTVITKGFIRRAHRHGMAVHAWTINDEEEMRRLIEMGVDGIITDLPTTLAGL